MRTAVNPRSRLKARRVPGVWRLNVCGIAFSATVERRHNKNRFRSYLVTVATDTPLVFIPGEVLQYFCQEVVALHGELQFWIRQWYWGQLKTESRSYRSRDLSPEKISEAVRDAWASSRGRGEDAYQGPLAQKGNCDG